MDSEIACPSGKVRYDTKQAALVVLTEAKIARSLRRDRKRREARVYCWAYCRGWHLASQSQQTEVA